MSKSKVDKQFVKELIKLKKEYEKICTKIEHLNDRAFELEKEIDRNLREEEKNEN